MPIARAVGDVRINYERQDAVVTKIQLDGTVVIMTGASVGLGRAMSLALASAGARVVLAAPEPDRLEAVAAEIEAVAGPGRTLVARTDITVRADCDNVIRECLRRFGTVQVLVNNARRPVRGPGLPPAGNFLPFWESNPDIWQESINVNVNGTFQLSHVVAPYLIRNGWGRIINISTSLGGMIERHNSPYGVSKAALESATAIWAADLADTGVTVNSLLPGGACDTDPNRLPVPGRTLLPVEVMNSAVVWLASRLSDGKTGGRYVGKLWHDSLPPNVAAERASEKPVIRLPEQ
jgi:3-oxoacyl-[acyl-carrier protein] reductase